MINGRLPRHGFRPDVHAVAYSRGWTPKRFHPRGFRPKQPTRRTNADTIPCSAGRRMLHATSRASEILLAPRQSREYRPPVRPPTLNLPSGRTSLKAPFADGTGTPCESSTTPETRSRRARTAAMSILTASRPGTRWIRCADDSSSADGWNIVKRHQLRLGVDRRTPGRRMPATGRLRPSTATTYSPGSRP